MPQAQPSTETLLFLSRERIEATFLATKIHVFSPTQIHRLIGREIDGWVYEVPHDDPTAGDLVHGRDIPITSTSHTAVLRALLEHTQLQRIALPFAYREETRYTWNNVSTHELIQSLDREGYFSHYTAMHLHGLTEQIPKTIYFNVEQTARPGGGTLSQQAIDRAFKGKCRVSNNVAEVRGLRVYKLNGANTGQLGVTPFTTDEGDQLRVTNIERTLIDAVVRPVYAGGIAEVAEAFRAAADRLSVRRLSSYLRKLNYTYPYHQAIGFYMERAGVYTRSQVNAMRRFPIEFDFYLNYQLKNPHYNAKWRLYVPQRF